jgi:formylglycine-generating enzyme required for sulfatase activity
MLMAQVLPGHATDHGIEWKSSDERVVKVDTNGIVTALKSGSATISATSASDSRKYGECVVTVNQFVFMKGGIVPSGYDWGGPEGTGGKTTSPVSVAPFHISETEVRYELWYEVKKWGEGYGYKFVNEGKAGSSGSSGVEPIPAEDKDQPVTMVSWRDMVVWCNAYSEMTGKEAVYYDETGAILLRDATAGTPAGDTVDGATQQDRNGYRLPKEKEWEYAARGGVPSSSEPWIYKYAGTDAYTELVNFAWYNDNSGNTTHLVRQKLANSAGLYDMNGNVWEWCFDKIEGSSFHVMRGGCWDSDVPDCPVARRRGNLPDSKYSNLGFRLVCR